MRINVLIENSRSKYLKSQHGLSFLIYCQNQKILYDFGKNKSFISNSNKLGIDLNNIDLAVLSHHHVDHGGGINDFLNANKTCSVITTGDINLKYYTKLMGFFKISIGLDIKKEFEQRIIYNKNNTMIGKNIYLITEISSQGNSNVINNALFMRDENILLEDKFEHENALVIDEDGFLTIFNSCSHKGVLNTIDAVKSYFPDRKIKNYIGGFHLYNPVSKKKQTDDYIEKLAVKLTETEIKFYTCHCTGEYSYNILKKIMSDNITYIKTGDVLEI
ncbi:MAG: MBL fold metallo-hydrolase [Spirochaetes bacterium]|nr:MBL fold metallo-hydrolase [Spirochaetota bacterium]